MGVDVGKIAKFVLLIQEATRIGLALKDGVESLGALAGAFGGTMTPEERQAVLDWIQVDAARRKLERIKMLGDAPAAEVES